MLLGLGADVVSVARIAALHNRYAKRFLSRVLHPLEQAAMAGEPAQLQAQWLAGRWAGKEAVYKAMWSVVRLEPRLNFANVVVNPQGSVADVHMAGGVDGHSVLSIDGADGAALRASAAAQRMVARVSISHDAGLAFAVVALDQRPVSS